VLFDDNEPQFVSLLLRKAEQIMLSQFVPYWANPSHIEPNLTQLSQSLWCSSLAIVAHYGQCKGFGQLALLSQTW
jgi:hypothetical protein